MPLCSGSGACRILPRAVEAKGVSRVIGGGGRLVRVASERASALLWRSGGGPCPRRGGLAACRTASTDISRSHSVAVAVSQVIADQGITALSLRTVGAVSRVSPSGLVDHSSGTGSGCSR